MKTHYAVLVVVVVATIFGSSCRGRDSDAQAPANSGATGAVPTIESELAAFRTGLTNEPRELVGAPTRDSLVRLFEKALAANDSAALDRLEITREEFAYLYYPESKLARPPYELDPQTMWMQIDAQRQRGLRRLLARYGGRGLKVRGLECRQPERENAVVIHQCLAVTSEAATPMQLFGSILERDGRFKFVGYANRL
jgi:hypothetical protein